MMRICFHGAESTGKSTLARKLGEEFGWPVVREFGRTYAELHGPDFNMADLITIARRQDLLQREAMASAPHQLLDTDPLMTAAWAEMLFGDVPDELLAYPKAELYLMFAADVPWVDDGTRCFGTPRERARFSRIAEDMLVRAGVPYRLIAGNWAAREALVRRAIASLVS
jgi:NadR type nicotinamide-nucleotide adenylyltransferase